MKTILSLLIFFNIVISAQMEKSDVPTRAKYYQDFLNFSSGPSNQTRLDVFIQVPYSEMQFVLSDKGYTANYNVNISIFDEDKEKLISEKNWSEKIDAPDFNNSVSKTNYNLSLKSFNLAPGKYNIRTQVEDKESNKSYTTENLFTVRDMNTQVMLSDIMLIAKQTVVDGNTKIIPNISRNVYAQKEGLQLFYEIYSKVDTAYNIEYKVEDSHNKDFYSQQIRKKIDSGKTQIFYTIKDSSFSLGKYIVTINIKNDKNKVLATTAKAFFSKWQGAPDNLVDLDKAVAQMMYIATDKELSYIKDAKTKEEKLKRYLEFWKKKDPVPSTEENEVFDEYYRRVQYANEHFSSYTEGWKSDRGMVYIIMGNPSNIERHPFDYDSKPYEIWDYYNLNKEFIFLDESGFGNYRLITPLNGDDYRYREN